MNETTPGLNRALGLRELVLYGIVLIQPTAPMPLYGVVCQEAKGHVVTTVLIGMVAMLFTAISYGRMARAYPSAGSAYTYVGRELHPALGYLTGWAMIFDYILNPTICVIWCGKAAMNFVPTVPFAGWAVFFAVLFTLLNLRGIKASARTNEWITAGLGVVIILFFIAAARTIFRSPDHTVSRFLLPFYDPSTFSWKAVSTGTSIAMLTYIGFDGISTLSEEAHNPRRNILLATVLTCLLTGVLAASQVYAAQLVWPGHENFPDVDTAFVHIAGYAGGPTLFVIVNLALLLATIGSGSGSHLAAGRLLYGMGRDNAIPSRFFSALDPRTQIPRNNILLVGGLALAGAFSVSYQLGAELLNFGTFIGFMGVNIAAFVRYYVRAERQTFLNLAPPLIGFVICLYIWWSLRPVAKMAGLAWLTAGLLYGAWKTRGFRHQIQFAAVDEL
ncbi:MAG: APC family permease [Isosphaeraceae bacterium]